MKKSGTNIPLNNLCSKIAFSYAKKTFKNTSKHGEVLQKNMGFANVINFFGYYIGITSDGIGSKIEVAERIEKYDTLGFDLVAMVADDLICAGIRPTNISNILDVDYLDKKIIKSLMLGLKKAADFAGISIVGGEIAELGKRVSGYGNKMHFNWCATAIGSEITPMFFPPSFIDKGDIVISLASNNFRSNGFSLAKNILKMNYGVHWHDSHLSDDLIQPSLIYSPLICDIYKKYKGIKGLAHVTGGGIYKINRILKNGLSMKFLDQQDPPLIMNLIRYLGDIPIEKAYKTWNMGHGMFIVVPKDAADFIIRHIKMLNNKDKYKKYNYNPKIVGEIVSTRKNGEKIIF